MSAGSSLKDRGDFVVLTIPFAMSLLTGKAKLAGVIGWPVGHSRSPRLHGHWLARYQIDGAYVPLAVKPEDLPQVLAALPKLGFSGLNITLPHKERALELVDEADDVARRIGAANTIWVGDDKRLCATNTDAFGFIETLRTGARNWHAGAGPALMLGAGGAARAVLVALLDAGVPEIRIANRTRARADALAEEFGDRAVPMPWPVGPQALDGAQLLVNATSLGMSGQPPLDVRLDALGAGAVVMDIVYTPLETALLAEARSRGLVAVDGLDMLLHQARPGFEKWFGVAPQVDQALHAEVLRDLQPGPGDKA